MKRAVAFGISVILVAAVAFWWTWYVHENAQRRKTIKFAYLGSTEDARNRSALQFKQYVESESRGAIQVELYYGGQLGGDRDAIEGVRLGTIEMTTAGAGIFANFEPRMGVTALPYLFRNFDEAWAFCGSELYARVTRKLRQKGIRVLGFWDNGFRCITNSRRPIRTPEDLRGMKIRTPENPMVLAAMKALGASPSPLPWTELYMALQQGAFDGQENPVPTIYWNKVYEVQHYLSTTYHVYDSLPVVISGYFWNGLNPGEQQLIQRAVRRSQEYNRSLVRRLSQELLETLQEQGMEITHPDRGPFEAATRHVRDQFVESMGAELISDAYQFAESLR